MLENYIQFTIPIFFTIRLFVLHSDEFNLNNNSGHSEKNSSNKLFAVQTPATNFTINTKTVSMTFLFSSCFYSSTFRLRLILEKKFKCLYLLMMNKII